MFDLSQGQANDDKVSRQAFSGFVKHLLMSVSLLGPSLLAICIHGSQQHYCFSAQDGRQQPEDDEQQLEDDEQQQLEDSRGKLQHNKPQHKDNVEGHTDLPKPTVSVSIDLQHAISFCNGDQASCGMLECSACLPSMHSHLLADTEQALIALGI